MKTLKTIICFAAIAGLCANSLFTSAQVPDRVSGVLIELNKPGTIDVALSVGADDGVRVGDKLTVTHDGQVLGTVEIIKIQASHSTAKIIDVAAGKSLSKNDVVKAR